MGTFGDLRYELKQCQLHIAGLSKEPNMVDHDSNPCSWRWKQQIRRVKVILSGIV